jgi:hypothetical protein
MNGFAPREAPTSRRRKRALGGCLALASLTAFLACAARPTYVSPTTAQGPPKFIGPPIFFDSDASAAPPADVTLALAPTAPAPSSLASPVFFKTLDSNEWVDKTIKVQATYTRVLVVDASGKPPANVPVAALSLNARTAGEAPAPVEQKVDLTFTTLQDAADASLGGDLVAVMPGSYAGFSIGDKPSAEDGKYIHFKALGNPGEVVIDRPSALDKNWMFLLQATHHIIVQGFNLAGQSQPGQPVQSSPNAGVFLDGDFGRSSKQTHHVVLLGNFSHNHRKWGIHSTDTHTVLVQDNVFAHSGMQHSAYFSDGSDNYVIRRNVFFGSPDSGLQVNVDPVASLDETMTNPAMRDAPQKQPTREWAMAVIKLATERFGENNFPDGRGRNMIIEENVINGNGSTGGGALNLAGVQDSLVQNNLIYGNFAHGIAQWNNANPFDAAAVTPGPRSAAEASNPDVLPFFGCHGNLIRNNTVLMSKNGRFALQSTNGSYGTRSRNNVLVNDEPFSIDVSSTSIFGWDAGYNVWNEMTFETTPPAWKVLALSTGESNHGATGINRASLASQFVRYGDEPWILFEGAWWRLNPQRPDFHPKAGSKLLAGKGDPKEEPFRDLEGQHRTAADIGAFVAR